MMRASVPGGWAAAKASAAEMKAAAGPERLSRSWAGGCGAMEKWAANWLARLGCGWPCSRMAGGMAGM